MRLRNALASLTLLSLVATLPGCALAPQQQSGGDIAYVEDENARLKQLLIQYENDARNNQVMIADANGRVQRSNLELEAANRKIGVYEQEIPRLRSLAVQAAQSAQSANQAQYAQYQQYVQYMNQMQKNQAKLVGTGQGTLRQDLSQQLTSLADQFGGVVVGNRIELPGDFFFDSGRYNLNPNARAAIRRMAEILAGENLQLMIAGHTDNDPIKNPALRSKGITDNLHLSLLRAKAVVDELKKAGYPSHLMYPTGWGETRPIVPNTDRASKKLNRRVDILIDPTPAQAQGMAQIMGVEPIGPSSGVSGGGVATQSQAVYDGEPMSTTYVQGYQTSGYPQASAAVQTTTTTYSSPSWSSTSSYSPSSSSSYSTITSVETVEGTDVGTADLIGAPTVYGSSGYDSYSAPTTSYGGYSEPSYAVPSYSAPEPSYSVPSYGSPAPSYGTPEPFDPYSTPGPSFGVPQGQGYGAPQQFGVPMPAAPGYAQPQFGDPFTQVPSSAYNQPLAMGGGQPGYYW